MPKAKSRQQQRLYFALARRGVITMREAKLRARKGKAYKSMPKRVRRRRKR